MKEPPESSVKEPLGRIMGHISRLFLAGLHQNLSHLDIERSYYPLLLIDAGNGILTQQELAQKLACDKVQVVRIIDYLSSVGYVQRGQNARDRRKISLEITDKARLILPDIRNAMQEISDIALTDISEDHVDVLYSLLKKIEKNLATFKTN